MESTICRRCSRRAGLTLIEVVAAIAILGTILVGVVLAKSRHTHQLALSQRRNDAVRAADELLTAWWASSQSVPIGAAGAAGTDGSLTWETRVVENEEIKKLGARVVRLEMRESLPKGTPSDAQAEPLIAVELVLPDPAREAVKADEPPGVGK